MTRTYARVTVDLEPGWRVGSWAAAASDVRGTARDPLDQDRPWAPGSSVAGSLRRAAGERADELFGCLRPGAEGEPVTQPSQWWVLGTVLTSSGDAEVTIETRKQTAISRHRRAPAEHGLSESEEVGRARLRVYLRSDGGRAADLVEVVKAWTPQLGGGRTTGLGVGTVTELVHRSVDLASRDGLLAVLSPTGDAAARVDRLLRRGTTEQITPAKPRLVLEATLSADRVGLLEDDTDDDQLRPGRAVTHGSQWKGMLRSRVEMIARSLGHPACITEQSWTGCGGCDLCAAFGSTTRSGAWELHSSSWSDGATSRRGRNAIDRFTGGVRDKVFFTEHHREQVEMTLRVTSSRDDVPGWVTTALLHALRDLNDGLWGIGPRTSTGLGTVRVTSVTTDQLVDLARLEPVRLPQRKEAS